MKSVFLSVVAAIVLTLGIYALSLLPRTAPTFGQLENIHGILFPENSNSILIEEPLAHADAYLNQPVFAKKLVVKVDFIPTTIDSLSLGIRENDFWLSYPKYSMYERGNTITYNLKPITSTVTIPLTDKFQETNRSLDLMFFAEGENIQWELVNITADVQQAWPSYLEFKDYARAILKRERAQ